jgi:hypothetical protein
MNHRLAACPFIRISLKVVARREEDQIQDLKVTLRVAKATKGLHPTLHHKTSKSTSTLLATLAPSSKLGNTSEQRKDIVP